MKNERDQLSLNIIFVFAIKKLSKSFIKINAYIAYRWNVKQTYRHYI